jgi:hypothetical protein
MDPFNVGREVAGVDIVNLHSPDAILITNRGIYFSPGFFIIEDNIKTNLK